jgi:hypothetical protein
MTGAQVRACAAHASAAGCPLLYSLNRERSPHTELDAVSARSPSGIPDRSVRARHRLHERDEEAAQGGEAGERSGSTTGTS